MRVSENKEIKELMEAGVYLLIKTIGQAKENGRNAVKKIKPERDWNGERVRHVERRKEGGKKIGFVYTKQWVHEIFIPASKYETLKMARVGSLFKTRPPTANSLWLVCWIGFFPVDGGWHLRPHLSRSLCTILSHRLLFSFSFSLDFTAFPLLIRAIIFHVVFGIKRVCKVVGVKNKW